ncbi:MAG: fumarylacetoacetate hydrolase family protein [Chloroflexi bacterium]|nr:fumarylacetoacetate hydrolase family protein [Chloroflexota bacterium]
MKIVRFAAEGRVKYGVLHGDKVQTLRGTPFRGIRLTGEAYSLDSVSLMAPCQPSKIVAIGLNYRTHAQELKMPLPAAPLIFLKPPTAVIGPEECIIYPAASSRVDYEAELAVVIGKAARHVSTTNALSYVLGYTCCNDVTARDLQSQDGQWTRSKSFDTFAPTGPCIETELDAANVSVASYLNGERKQQGSTSDLIYSVPDLISFVSGIMTLLPGDVIATGTPVGVGPMFPGDTIEIRIDGIGTLRNYVTKDRS